MRLCMDWRSVKFDWNRARAFLVVAEEGSLSAAARALGMAQPTLGRQVSALERELGVVLFERTGRGLSLTPSGLDLLEHVRQMGSAASRVSLAAGGQATSVEGTISLTASEIYSAHLLPPVIARLRAQAPGITVEIVASNAAIDLRRREADIALRSFRPTQPDLVARKLGDDYARLYASRAYLQRVGPIDHPDDLARADIIGFDADGQFLHGVNTRLGLRLTPGNIPLLTGNHLVQWELAKQGLGVAMFPDSVARREPSLVPVLPELPPMEFPLWLTAHRELNTSRRVRLVFDLMAAELSRL
ncbi:LysR family transcriptional regulator [Rhodobacteraceae bacterium 2CG4]|uniref:LysR family transcriptional regulator n=1 Tax=Halovulum marinum TaxID=2662447 RepID=A0A6L5Z446_9RHOB|nr:LysR family transcriptional regulator [Halovulum marinum]MSU91361.1 LysR family transcriptional regulator [Halovulum marinum]